MLSYVEAPVGADSRLGVRSSYWAGTPQPPAGLQLQLIYNKLQNLEFGPWRVRTCGDDASWAMPLRRERPLLLPWVTCVHGAAAALRGRAVGRQRASSMSRCFTLLQALSRSRCVLRAGLGPPPTQTLPMPSGHLVIDESRSLKMSRHAL